MMVSSFRLVLTRGMSVFMSHFGGPPNNKTISPFAFLVMRVAILFAVAEDGALVDTFIGGVWSEGGASTESCPATTPLAIASKHLTRIPFKHSPQTKRSNHSYHLDCPM